MWHFLGIGAQKAGTTWLYQQLRRHPELRFPQGKERHFWNQPHDAAAVAAYLSSFGGPEVRAGEITPAYALLSREVLSEIRRLAPALRLLYLIRNPIERAWSSALMALARAEMTPGEASDQWFIDHFHSAGSLARGDYQRAILNWREMFGPEALLILRYESLRAEPEALLNRCFTHLGVATRDPAVLRAEGCGETVFAGSGQPLRPSLLPILRALYTDRIGRLAELLGEDLSPWLGDAP